MKTWKTLTWIAIAIAVPSMGSLAVSAEQWVDGPGYAGTAAQVPVEGTISPEFNPDNPWGPPPPGAPACEPATTCCSVCGQGSCSPPCWYLTQGVRILTRSRARYEGLIYREVDEDTQLEALSTKSDAFNIAPSYLATFGRYIGRDACNNDRFVEVSFWGLNEWELGSCTTSEADATFLCETLEYTGGDLSTPFPVSVVGFNGADRIEVDYDHSVNNIELNYRVQPRGRADRLVLKPNGRWVRQCQPGCYVSYVAGLRAMTIDDGFAMRSRGLIDIEGGPSNVATAGDYRIDTDNTLLGFQLGTDIEFRHCRWTWGGRFRVAPFLNFAEQESVLTTDILSNGQVQDYVHLRSGEDEGAAATIEFGFMADYRLTPHCVVELGYDLMWVPGVALAPDQLDFNLGSCPNLNNNATLFYHGLTMSLEFAF